MSKTPSVGVIVPVLNEAASIDICLHELLNKQTQFSEIIIVDGGSSDGTLEVLARHANDDRVTLVRTGKGRARQMNAAAACSGADILLFLHADTRLPDNAVAAIIAAIASGAEWGRFNVRLDDQRFSFRVIEILMNLRSCITGICTGDQAMFMRRDVFSLLQGYADIPLMEDIELSSRLNWFGGPACIKHQVLVSARRWQQQGILRTVLQMWWLRLLFWSGRSAEKIAYRYRNIR